MVDLPIPFKGPMVRAIIEGRKMKTRRILSGAVSSHPPYVANYKEGSCAVYEDADGCVWGFAGVAGARVGDRLWVREAWRSVIGYDDRAPRDIPEGTPVCYEADGSQPPGWEWGRYRHGMFMPRWASRITLIVESVKVERLQDISEEDAIAEGVSDTGRRDGAPYQHFKVIGFPEAGMEHEPIPVFSNLWEAINGPGSWKANPWVAAISFRVGCGNIDSDKWAAAGASEARP
jgi:hypothetical protein